MGFYRTHRAYLVAAIHVQRGIVDNDQLHEGFRRQSRAILQRLCGELDDIDAAAAEKPREGVIA